MTRSPQPPGFDAGRDATTEELSALPEISQEALQTLEECIKSHHVVEIDYTDAEGRRSTIPLRPFYIRYSKAHNLVVWGMPTNEPGWEELRFDRIHGVRDTGEVFTPN